MQLGRGCQKTCGVQPTHGVFGLVSGTEQFKRGFGGGSFGLFLCFQFSVQDRYFRHLWRVDWGGGVVWVWLVHTAL